MVEDVGGRRVSRVARVLVDVLWWLGLVATIGVAGWVLASPVVMAETGFTPEVDVDVTLVEGAGPQTVRLESTDATLEVEQARLQVTTSDRWFHFLATAMMLPVLGLTLWGLHLLRSFLHEVSSGKVFTATNATRLTRLGWLLVVIGFVAPLTNRGRAWLALEHLQLREVVVSPPGDILMQPMVLAGVLLLVLASAWRYGVQLQRDHDLTV